MNFTPVFKPTLEPKKNQTRPSSRLTTTLLFKDNLPLSTLLAIGGALSSLLVLALGRIALIIPAGILFAKLINALLITTGVKANSGMANVMPGKHSAQLPNANGTFGPHPASASVTVLHLGTRCNHPLGLLAPGMKELGASFSGMQSDLSARAEHYGLLASSTWTGTARAAGNELMYVMYFNDAEGLHRFAHDALHREAWNWWNASYKKHPYIAIWHEVFVAPAGSWETIYSNSHPTLLGAGEMLVKTDAGERWSSTLVDASRGVLRTSRGRMARTDGADNEKYGTEPYVAVADVMA